MAVTWLDKSWFDQLATVFSFVGFSVPSFFTGLLLMLVPKMFGALTPGLVKSLVQPSLLDPENTQQISMVFALILGVMMLWRLLPRGGWISAWPLNSSYVVYNEGLTHDCARVGEHL